MPGPLLHVGAMVQCSHGGQAQPTMSNPHVVVSGQPTVTVAAPWTIAGCALPPPTAGNGPCVSAQFTTAALRVTSYGQPLLLLSSQAMCVPTGTPLLALSSQTRVIAS